MCTRVSNLLRCRRCSVTPVSCAPLSMSTGFRRAIARSTSLSWIYGQWRQPTSSAAALARSRRQNMPPRHGRSAKPAKASEPPRHSKSSTSRLGRLRTADATLTLERVKLVNRTSATPAAWTWTRGGWRDRYPNNVAHARRKPTRSHCDRIWTARRPYRGCRDRRHAGAWRRRWRQVGPAADDHEQLHVRAWPAVSRAELHTRRVSFSGPAPTGCRLLFRLASRSGRP